MNIGFTECWLILGIIFILIEFIKLPGIGFLFISLGAFCNAIVTYNFPEITFNYQFAYFGIFSLIWWALLWWPLKMYIYKKNTYKGNSFNLIGSKVKVVESSLANGMVGRVEWSGTIMNAVLDNQDEKAEINEELYVKEVRGNILICVKKLT